MKRLYNLEFEQYQAMLEKQQGKCAICHRETKLYVDHCHETGIVRGLLCNHCNLGIGQLGDSADRLRDALDYLTQSMLSKSK